MRHAFCDYARENFAQQIGKGKDGTAKTIRCAATGLTDSDAGERKSNKDVRQELARGA